MSHSLQTNLRCVCSRQPSEAVRRGPHFDSPAAVFGGEFDLHVTISADYGAERSG